MIHCSHLSKGEGVNGVRRRNWGKYPKHSIGFAIFLLFDEKLGESNKVPLMGEMVGVDIVVIPGVCEGTDIVTNFGCSLSLSRPAPVP